MGKINVLSFAVANLIAAGEVVDRPSSVIKELLENAIDSGATRITVEIQNGGVTYMRVTDNGCGMTAEDLPVAIRRHATSKIREAEDLEKILTLGFRGEALAAIASVSDLRILSKPHGAQTGAILEAHAGNIAGVTERAAADGTTVIVENLFANVPARRKFLKKDITEAIAVGSVVEKIALSRPDIAIRLITDGTVKLDTVGDGNLKNTVYSVFGRDFASKMIPADLTNDGIRVYGFVGRSDNVRANRNYENFFINGRYVKSKTAGAAIEQAYTSYIPPEKFPCCVLFLTVNPAAVDVNVHPAKLEVKFSNEKPVFEAVYYAVRNALETNTERPDLAVGAVRKSGWSAARVSDLAIPVEDVRGESLKKRQVESELFYAAPTPTDRDAPPASAFGNMSAADYIRAYAGGASGERRNPAEEKKPFTVSKAVDGEIRDVPAKAPEPPVAEMAAEISVPQDVPQEVPAPREIPVSQESLMSQEKSGTQAFRPEERVAPPARPAEESAPVMNSLSYRIIGEAFCSYVIVEKGDRLLLIDKHAAHERILFEQLKAHLKGQAGASQLLMLPVEVMLTSEEVELLTQYRHEIEAVGFAFTAGKYTVSVTAMPEGIETDAIPDMLSVMADRIKNATGSARLTRDIIFEKALYQAACKAAIKAGREYPPEYIQWLVAKLMELPDITVCPHGRPVAMELTKRNLDHQFERS